MATDIRFTLNGRATSVRVDPEQTLLDAAMPAAEVDKEYLAERGAGPIHPEWQR